MATWVVEAQDLIVNALAAIDRAGFNESFISALERVVTILTSSVKDPPPMDAVEALLSKARVGMHFIEQSAQDAIAKFLKAMVYFGKEKTAP